MNFIDYTLVVMKNLFSKYVINFPKTVRCRYNNWSQPSFLDLRNLGGNHTSIYTSIYGYYVFNFLLAFDPSYIR